MVSVKIDSYTITPDNSEEACCLQEISLETTMLSDYDPADDSYTILYIDDKDRVLSLLKEKVKEFEREEKQEV